MSLIQTRVAKVDLSGVEFQLRRIADALELALSINKPQAIPGQDFDPDEFSGVFYSDEEAELYQQHLAKRIGGVPVENPGLY